MKITTTVCDICYCEGHFNEGESLHDCGELGDLCSEHFKEVYNYITKEKRAKSIHPTTLETQSTNGVVVKGTDVDTGEEVAVTFNSETKAESKPDHTAASRKKLPWL